MPNRWVLFSTSGGGGAEDCARAETAWDRAHSQQGSSTGTATRSSNAHLSRTHSKARTFSMASSRCSSSCIPSSSGCRSASTSPILAGNACAFSGSLPPHRPPGRRWSPPRRADRWLWRTCRWASLSLTARSCCAAPAWPGGRPARRRSTPLASPGPTYCSVWTPTAGSLWRRPRSLCVRPSRWAGWCRWKAGLSSRSRSGASAKLSSA